jgi:hypothetical protein
MDAAIAGCHSCRRGPAMMRRRSWVSGADGTHWTYRPAHRRLGVMRRLINSTYITLDG